MGGLENCTIFVYAICVSFILGDILSILQNYVVLQNILVFAVFAETF